jgi:hypothetical protein
MFEYYKLEKCPVGKLYPNIIRVSALIQMLIQKRDIVFNKNFIYDQ